MRRAVVALARNKVTQPNFAGSWPKLGKKDLLGISARGAEAIYSPPRDRAACILQT